MKVKILFFPLALVIAFAVGILWIKPEISAILEVRGRMTGILAELDELRLVNANIEALNADMDQHSEEVAFVKDFYLPEISSEDHILDRINFLAESSGLLVGVVGMERIGSEAIAELGAQQARQAEMADAPGVGMLGFDAVPMGLTYAASDPIPFITTEATSVTLFGTYDQTKTFLNRLYRVNAANMFVGIDIGKSGESGGDSGKVVPADMLQSVLIIHFPFLKSRSVAQGTIPESFQKASFDFSTIQSARDRATETITPIPVVSSPRPNPFSL